MPPAPEKRHLIEEPFLEPDGTRTTVGDALLQRLAKGAYREDACASVGIGARTLRAWTYKAAKARQELAAGGTIDERQESYVTFAAKLDKVEAEAILNDWYRLGQLAEGGIPVKRVTTKQTPEGVETTTTISHTLPDASALMWRMERRWGPRFAKRLEISGSLALAPEEKIDRAQALAQEIRDFQAGVEAGQQLAAERATPEG